MKHLDVSVQRSCQLRRQREYRVIQLRRFGVRVKRIDGRENLRRCVVLAMLDEQQRCRAAVDQVPVGIGEQRALDGTVVVRVLRDDNRLQLCRFSQNAAVQRMLPARVDTDSDSLLTQRCGKRLQSLLVHLEQLALRALERVRREKTPTRQVLIVIADQKLERCAEPRCEPGCAFQRRLLFSSRIDDDENALVIVHWLAWSCRTVGCSDRLRIYTRGPSKAIIGSNA